MRLSSLAGVLFASVVATGCATGADTAVDEGMVFDADGKADSATGAAARNPGSILLSRLNQCDERWQSGSFDNGEGNDAELYVECAKTAVNAAGWTAEWRAAQADTNFAQPFQPGSLVRGDLVELRSNWSNFCDGLRAGHSSAFDSDMQDHYFDMFCKRAGEHGTAHVMMDAFDFMTADAEQFRSAHLHTPHAFGCFEQFLAESEELEDRNHENQVYGRFLECTTSNLREFAASAEDFANAGIDSMNEYEGLAEDERFESVSTLSHLNDILESNTKVCGKLAIANGFKSENYYDEAEAYIPSVKCEVRLALYAFSQIEALMQDAGGSFDIEESTSEGE